MPGSLAGHFNMVQRKLKRAFQSRIDEQCVLVDSHLQRRDAHLAVEMLTIVQSNFQSNVHNSVCVAANENLMENST